MSFPAQKVFPGALAEAWEVELSRFVHEGTMTRLWSQDSSLWPAEKHHISSVKSNLCWLNLPEQIGLYVSKVMESARAVQENGLEQIVFVAMGSSNLAAAAALDLPRAGCSRKISLLDSTDPDAIRDVEAKLSLEKTLFVFANKSGKRIETHCLLLYFLDKLKTAGVKFPGEHFIALTVQNSYLATLALEYKFRNIFFDPPGIISRYSGLIHFSLFLTTINELAPAAVLETITLVRDACRPEAPPKENPAVALASFLVAGERRGLNRLILLSPPELFHFAYRIAELIGASTSIEGRGFIAIFGQQAYEPQTLKEKCLVVKLGLGGKPVEEKEVIGPPNTDTPMVEIELQPMDLAAEMFKWEMATALACASMGVNPFHDEHPEINLGIPAKRLENVGKKRVYLAPTARLTQGSLSLFAGETTRRMVSNLSLGDALRTFLQLRNRDSYIAILPFFKFIPQHLEILFDVRDCLRHGLGMPVQVADGPRYIYTLGQMYKDGPANGIFIMLTVAPMGEDLAIPGANYTFGEVHLALALADYGALENCHKPVIRLHLAQGAEKGLKEVRDIVIQTVGQITRNAG